MFIPKRLYLPPTPLDGYRVLVDRLWPRGIQKSSLKADLWLKEVAPSNELRQWYGHDPEKWEAFLERYRQELTNQPESVERLLSIEAVHGTVTLLFTSKEEALNNAVALQLILEEWVA